ncbi:MAG: aldehyde ferredoxin oxidoreductase family protein [Desulfovibrionaceae bacterium]
MHGWTGRFVLADLDRGRCETAELPRDDLERFLGGRGLAGRLAGQRIDLDWDDPDSMAALCAGPLTGTLAPASGRLSAGFRSPLTGGWGDASVGGGLGVELKRAGLDALLITGRSKSPCALVVQDGRASIEPAGDLAGLGVDEVGARAAQAGAGSWAAIGPAAEAGVRFACLMVDGRHAAGRAGLGRVLAAKNLKLITVKGAGRTSVYDKQALRAAREEIVRLTAASPVLMGRHGFLCYGTAALYDLMDARRMTPTANFRATRFEHAPELNAAALKRRYAPSRHACRGCHIGCKQVAETGETLPEFETLSHFTALIGNTDLDTVVRANEACNRLGMDTISAAATLACHQEVTGDALPPGRILELLEEVGRGSTELGRALGGGSARYAAERGRPAASMSVKGMELPAYDPRGAYGMALGFAVSTRGGCHLRAYPVSHEILRKPVATDRFSFSGKARIVKLSEDAGAVVDSLTACKFVFFAATLEEYAKALQAVTGVSFTAGGLMQAGERICLQEREMNARLGFAADDDDLPARFFTEPGTGGAELDIPAIDREDFLDARARYYRIRGLDEQGRPRQETMRRLGLSREGGE